MKNNKLITVNVDMRYQTMEGWGTSLAWWANMVGSWDMLDESGREKRDEIMDLVFDTEKGLGLNIVRYNIGGGDDPTHNHIKRVEAVIPGYKDSQMSDYNWEADRNQVWVLKEAIEKRKNYGDDIIIETFSNTPPYWMTESGCASGNVDPGKDNLKPEFYEEFAKYLVDITKYFKDRLGITFDYLEPINEAASAYWQAYSTKQEGAHFDQGSSQSKIYSLVYKELEKQGLLNDVKLSGTDETSIDDTIVSFEALDSEAKSCLYKINTHAYSGTKREELREIAEKHNKKLWMSEVCLSKGDYDIESMDTPLELCKGIYKDLKDLKASAWVFWQVVESMLECLKWKKDGGNWGLINGVYEDKAIEGYHDGIDMDKLGLKKGDYVITKQFYALGQFSKFIKPGYTILDVDDSEGVAAISSNGNELVLVLMNHIEDEKNFEISFNGFDISKGEIECYRTSEDEKIAKVDNIVSICDKNYKVYLKGRSITTVVIKRN